MALHCIGCDIKGRPVNAKEALAIANEQKLTFLTNRLFEENVVMTGLWKRLIPIGEIWTGTLVAYGAAGKKLGQFIKYTDPKDGSAYVFEVPVEARNQKNTVLAVDHGFTINNEPMYQFQQDGNNTFVEVSDPKKIRVIKRFPANGGSYLAENEFVIPAGRAIADPPPHGRFLERAESYVGLVLRCPVNFFDFVEINHVFLNEPPSSKCHAIYSCLKSEPPLEEGAYG